MTLWFPPNIQYGHIKYWLWYCRQFSISSRGWMETRKKQSTEFLARVCQMCWSLQVSKSSRFNLKTENWDRCSNKPRLPNGLSEQKRTRIKSGSSIQFLIWNSEIGVFWDFCRVFNMFHWTKIRLIESFRNWQWN